MAGLKCRPALYARCLLDVLELERNWRPIMAVPGARSVEITSKRLEDIMVRAESFHAKTPRWAWAILAIAAILVLPGRALVFGQGEIAPSATAKEETKPMKAESIVTGQVVDAAGKPVGGAKVAVVGRRPMNNRRYLAKRRPMRQGVFA